MDQRFKNVCGRSREDLWLFDDPNQRHWRTDIGVAERRSQHHIERKDHAVLVIQVCVRVTGMILNRRVMCVAVRVGDGVLVTVCVSRPVDVAHRRQREYADCQTEHCRQKGMTHYAACYAMQQTAATEDWLNSSSESGFTAEQRDLSVTERARRSSVRTARSE